ncbi:MAG: hypothetical protein U0835_04310 [Isosphaeraceae bacterium]
MRGKTRAGRAFRPVVEGVEERALTATGAGTAVLGLGAGVFQAARWLQTHSPKVGALGYPQGLPGPLPITPGLGNGLIRLALPQRYQDYGVITIWNNTRFNVSFQVAASTFSNGLFYPFALPPGGVRSFYAGFVGGKAPVFLVSVNPNFKPNVIPEINVVFEAQTYIPAGTAGRPYAINLGANGTYLSFI